MTALDATTPLTMRQRLWSWQARFSPYLFIAPFVIIFCVFLLYPLCRSLAMSLQQTAGARVRFVGIQNFLYLLQDQIFWFSVLNTLVFTIAFIVFQIPAALLLALTLNSQKVRGRNLFRFAFFTPHLVGQVFVAVIFGLMLANNGPVNSSIRSIVPTFEAKWLADPILGRGAVIIASMWLSVGFGTIYFLAALQSVDRELYEASSVDGAGSWSQFWHVTLPGIRPVLSFMILTGTIAGLQLFELPYVLFNGPGPGGAGLTIVAYLFSWIEMGELGTAAAIGWCLAAVIIGIAIVQVRMARRRSSEV